MSPEKDINNIDIFKSMLDKILVYEISKIDYAICICLQTETLLIIVEPYTPIKQAMYLAALAWNIPSACFSSCGNAKETK